MAESQEATAVKHRRCNICQIQLLNIYLEVVPNHTGCDYLHDHSRFLLHSGLQELKSAGQNPKGIPHPSATDEPVIEYLLTEVQDSAREEFHQPLPLGP